MNKDNDDKGFEPHDKAANSKSGPQETLNASDEDQAVLEEILNSFENINLWFDPEVLSILEDDEATAAKLESLKNCLGDITSARLLCMANSIYYGGISSGHITKFVDVVTRMGAETVKTTAVFLAQLALAKTAQMKEIFARSFATSKVAEVIANQLGLSRSEKGMVSLGGLFVEMGMVIMLLYTENEGKVLHESFMKKHHSYVGAKFIEKLKLSSLLKEIVCHQYLTFVKKDSLALSAIVDFAHSVVEKSFSEHGKLIIQSSMPDPEGILYNLTIGSLMESQFQALGLGSYLTVVPSELSEQEKRFCESHKKP